MTSHVYEALASPDVPVSAERSRKSEFLALKLDEFHRTPLSRQAMAFEDLLRPEHDVLDLQLILEARLRPLQRPRRFCA